MILGIILVLLSVLALHLIYKTDLEDAAVESWFPYEEIENRVLLHVGIAILFIIGLVYIIKDFI